MQVRVRFAPSPTGALHIGGVRTALYNYLFARKHKGDFILRIEDTDQSRFVEGALEYIYDSLSWLGINPDEGLHEGGKYGPYQQSQRKELYNQYAQKLIDSGNAYYAFDTSEELEAMRNRLSQEQKDSRLYNYLSRNEMKNSLTLSREETTSLIEKGTPYVVRLKVPESILITFEDNIRGSVTFESSNIDDKVLLKSDGMPTYHLANVIDDHLMEISHVIRGEEWLSSTPIHVLLYRALGWEDEMPQFAHLPLLLKPDGNGKLSKRDADKQGFPIFPLSWTDPRNGESSEGFRERGFLPEALINFLAFLGWNPGTEKELYSMKELCEDFSLDRIQKAGARFDFEKALWFNQIYTRNLSNESLKGSLKSLLEQKGIAHTNIQIEQAVMLLKDRITFISDLYEEAEYLWLAPIDYDETVVKKKWKSDTADGLKALVNTWKSMEDFSSDKLQNSLAQTLSEVGISPGKIMQPLRLAITGKGGGPDLMGIIAFLGKEESISRMLTAIEKIKPS